MKTYFYYIVFCLLVACNGKSNKNENVQDGLIVLDWDKDYPLKEISLQEIADVEYIPMETRADVLLDGNSFHLTLMSDSLLVTQNESDDIFVFNRRGKNIHVFNRTGRGGEQYTKIAFMAADFTEQEIFITAYPRNQTIKVYAFDGTFKRVLKLPQNYELSQFFDYDKESLIAIDEYDLRNKKELLTNPRPYVLISKKDGSVVPVDLTFDERVSDDLYVPEMKGTLSWSISALLKNGRECFISDFGSDTIYSLENRKLLPVMVKRPSRAWKLNPPKVACVRLKTKRYIFVDFFEKKFFQEGVPENYRKLVYDRQTGELFTYRLINRDYHPGKVEKLGQFFCDLPAGYVREKKAPTQLLQDYEAGRLRGKLKEVASRLDEEDNTVLMLVKFKE